MPDQAYRHAQLPGRQTKVRLLLANQLLEGDTTNNPRVIVDTLLAIDHNGASGRPWFATVRS
jgi:hypothetical protein